MLRILHLCYMRWSQLKTAHPRLLKAHFAGVFPFLRASGFRDLLIRVLAP
jgi:hypothetical protein